VCLWVFTSHSVFLFFRGVDYVAVHVWPQNWLWYDPKATTGKGNAPTVKQNGAGVPKQKTLENAMRLSAAYVENAARAATALGKPLVNFIMPPIDMDIDR